MQDMDIRGSKGLLERLSANTGVPRDFAEELLDVLGDARPLELTKHGEGVKFTFMGDIDDADWCGNSMTKILKLRRKYPVPIRVHWSIYGTINPELLIGEAYIEQNLAVDQHM